MIGTERVALVTGAGSGIGREVTRALLKEGYAVALLGRRAQLLEETVATAGAEGKRALVLPTDVRSEGAVKDAFARLKAQFGRLDLLFNNAGMSAKAVLFEDLTFTEWSVVVESCLTGAFLCSREAFRLMKSQEPRGGRIINNGSISAQTPRPDSAPYTSAKHAITGLTKSLALDGRKYNIACGQIDIGNADTSMTRRMKSGVRQANGTVAVEPTIEVEHVARAVLYMASLPLEANVLSMTVMATHMPFVGRG